MTSKKETFQDDGKTKWFFGSNIDVVCPKCSRKASLRSTNQELKVPELKCNNCYYSKSGYEHSTFQNTQKAVCVNCNSMYSFETKDLPISVNKANVKCPDCLTNNQVVVEFDLSDTRDIGYTIAKDPFYHLDFWFKINYRNNCFWAYNLEHLSQIESYIKAEDRKRHLGNYQSMVEKLPKWVSSKKNRKDMLKLIDKLKVKTE